MKKGSSMNCETYMRLWNACRSVFPEKSPINFFPIIGKDYFKAPVRILVLGHSHYSSEEKREKYDRELHDITFDSLIGGFMQRRYARNYGSFHEMRKGDKFSKTFQEIEWLKNNPGERIAGYWKDYRKMGNIICNQPDRNHDCDYVWDNISFYNYFQKIVGNKPRDYKWLNKDKPNFKKTAELAFFGLEDGVYKRKCESVMGRLAPQIVIVWGDIVKDDLPKPDGFVRKELSDIECFSYKAYPETTFFPMNHPASSKWNSVSSAICQRFYKLREFFPIENLVQTHSSVLPRVIDLAKEMRPYTALFDCYHSEISYVCRLYEIVNGIANDSADRSMYLDAYFKEDGCVDIRFYTQDFKSSTAKGILKSQEFSVSDDVFETEHEGRYTLATFPADSSIFAIADCLRVFMEKMKAWRENNKH